LFIDLYCSYFLERSQSARVTLAKAIELCQQPDKDLEEELMDSGAYATHVDEAVTDTCQENDDKSKREKREKPV